MPALPHLDIHQAHSVNQTIVPDFRSSTGLFSTLRTEHKLKASGKHLFDASVYQTDSSTSSFHDMVRSLSHLVSTAKPTAFHQMLSSIASEGRLMRLYTQNVDGIDVGLPSLETRVPLGSKGPWPRAIQLHGGLKKMVCSKCNHLSDFDAGLFEGPEPPPCVVCIETDKVRTNHAGKRSHGIGKLRPRIVLYNEHNPDEDAIGAVMSSDLRARPDAVIVVGTSMRIPGVRRIVKEMCSVVRARKDGLTMWINNEPPPSGKDFDNCWDLIVRGPSDKVAKYWNDANHEYTECTESEVERAKQRTGEVKVIMQSSQGPMQEEIGILTPGRSPAPSFSEPFKVEIRSSGMSPLARPPTWRVVGKSVLSEKGSRKTTKMVAGKSQPKPLKLSGKGSSVKKRNAKLGVEIPKTRIDTAFRTSKPSHSGAKDLPIEEKNGIADKQRVQYSLMHHIASPSGLHNPSIFSQTALLSSPLTPDPSKSPTPVSTSPSEGRPWKERSNDIISPIGAIPKDMVKLLN